MSESRPAVVSAGELVYGKRRALPAHPVHAHPSSRSSHKPSDVVRPTETRCRFCAGRMSSYEVGEAVAISKQAGRPGRAPYRPGKTPRTHTNARKHPHLNTPRTWWRHAPPQPPRYPRKAHVPLPPRVHRCTQCSSPAERTQFSRRIQFRYDTCM